MRATTITSMRHDMAAHWTPVIRVSGPSMLPTLRSGSIVITRPRLAGVRRGDVIVFARGDGRRYVKRVAAIGGDAVEMEAGALRVNHRSLGRDDPSSGAFVERWKVPSDHVFVVGDNDRLSDDSRVWAAPFVRHEDVTGVVIGWRAMTQVARPPA